MVDKKNIHFNKIDSNNLFYPSGTGIILSKNSVNILLNDNIDYNIIDDVSIGLILSKTIKFHKIKRYDCKFPFNINIFEFSKDNLDNDLFLYRCKTDNNHTNTIYIMNKLLKLFYNIND